MGVGEVVSPMHFPNDYNTEYLFKWLLSICMSFYGKKKSVFKFFGHFKIGFVFLIVEL